MLKENEAIIQLNCADCDNLTPCGFGKRYFGHDPKSIGCARKVSQEIHDEYIYRMYEDYPFYIRNENFTTAQKTAKLNELLEWLHQNIYTAPLIKVRIAKHKDLDAETFSPIA